MRRLFLFLLHVSCFFCGYAQTINLVFTSDLHYGIYRPHFRGGDSVASFVVNAAAVKAMNALPLAGIKNIEAIVITGDIANREEEGIQSASDSWKQFLHDYRDGITLKNSHGKKPPLLVTPGNHDASNAAGHPKIKFRDAGAMTGMFELEKNVHLDTAVYNYRNQKLNYSRDIGGIHFLFVNIWPDSANREWIEKDLAVVNNSKPVLLFSHDPPQGDQKHFTAPAGYQQNSTVAHKYEHVLDEVSKDTLEKSTIIEQRGLTSFLLKHTNIKAWFHGHENFCQMYDYTGVSGELQLPVFRSDSPMKGEKSRNDETTLSFQVISIDPGNHTLTSRECFWNKQKRPGKLLWGMLRKIVL